MLLAGDIGGTKTNLAIFPLGGEPRVPLIEATFPSGQYASLEALVTEFLSRTNVTVERACFGVAGPVVAGQAKVTNLPWSMDEQRLQEALHIPKVRLLNDLDAMAHGVPFLQPEDLYTLNTGKAVPDGTLAVIAPGTGLGEAFLTWEGDHYHAHASEGGHTDFGPTNSSEMEMLRYLLGRFDHVSYEHIASGIGLPNIYAYYKEVVSLTEPAWLTAQLATASDPTPIIIAVALDKTRDNELCSATLRTFVSILGAEAGNLALKVLANGGVYIGGGIPPRILPHFMDETFLHAFQAKGRFTQMLANIPVHIITNPKLALLGAARHGLEN
jgi:glucokinase